MWIFLRAGDVQDEKFLATDNKKRRGRLQCQGRVASIGAAVITRGLARHPRLKAMYKRRHWLQRHPIFLQVRHTCCRRRVLHASAFLTPCLLHCLFENMHEFLAEVGGADIEMRLRPERFRVGGEVGGLAADNGLVMLLPLPRLKSLGAVDGSLQTTRLEACATRSEYNPKSTWIVSHAKAPLLRDRRPVPPLGETLRVHLSLGRVSSRLGRAVFFLEISSFIALRTLKGFANSQLSRGEPLNF